MPITDDVRARARAWLAGAKAAEAETKPAKTGTDPAIRETPRAKSETLQGTPLAMSIASALARRFEGLYLTPYLCPAGVPSVGYGATYYEDGTRVQLTDPPISRERAEALLLWMVRTVYLPAVVRLCPGVDNPQRLAALIDFTFNLGSGRLSSSTLRKRVNEGRWEDVPGELRKWVYGGGRVLKGLVLRREAEVVLV